MKTSLTLSTIALLSNFAFAQGGINQDSIIFKDGGNFYGNFKGFTADGDISWNRKGNAKTQSFTTAEISKVIDAYNKKK